MNEKEKNKEALESITDFNGTTENEWRAFIKKAPQSINSIVVSKMLQGREFEWKEYPRANIGYDPEMVFKFEKVIVVFLYSHGQIYILPNTKEFWDDCDLIYSCESMNESWTKIDLI